MSIHLSLIAPDNFLQKLSRRKKVHIAALEASTAEHIMTSFLPAPDLSWASLSALGDGLEKGHYLRADPVCLQADLSQVYLLGNAELDLSAEEISQLVAELNEHLAQDKLKLIAAKPKRWYLQLTKEARVETHPWFDKLAKPIANYLPKDADRYWERLMTELQMMLHASVVNQRRKQQGKASIDTLWLFGSNTLPESKSSFPMVALWTDSPWAKGLALYHGIPVMDLNEPIQLKLNDNGHYVVYSENSSLDSCLDGILAKLEKNELDCLEIYPLNGKAYRVKKRSSSFLRLLKCLLKN